MTRIPVRQTIAQSYRFAGARYLSLLGILWFPLLIYLVVTYVMTKGMIEHLLSAHSLNDGVRPSSGRIRSLVYLEQLLSLVFFAVASVAFANEVLGKAASRRFVYLRFGTQEFRALVSFLLLTLFVYTIVLVAGIVGGAIIAALAVLFLHGLAKLPLLVWVIALALLITVIPAVYIAVRLGFFVASVAAAENRFGLLRSWEMTRGNFWRCFAISIATAAPGVLLTIVLFCIMYGRIFIYVLSHIASAPQFFGAVHVAILRKAFAIGPYFWPVDMILAPLTIGILLSAGPIAYRGFGPDRHSPNAMPGLL